MSENREVNPFSQNNFRPEVYTKLPDGRIVNVFDLLEKHRQDLEPIMSVGCLKKGDLVAFRSTDVNRTETGMIFDITDSQWNQLGISGGFSPCPTLTGRLDGPNLPDEVKNQKAIFIGSGFGGSMVSPGILATNRSPYFYLPEGEYRAPYADLFEVFRKNKDGQLKPLDPNQLGIETRNKNVKHAQRLAKAKQLMKQFGFGNFNFEDGSRSVQEQLEYEDSRYIAEYAANMAMGNQLVIFDKQTGQWMEFKYYNFKNDDFLQIAFADLSSHSNSIREIFSAGKIIYESGIHRSGSAITTFCISGNGIEAVNYKPGNREATDILHIPAYGNNIFTPDIQIWPDGRIEIPNNYPISLVEEKHPGLLDTIKNSTVAITSGESVVSIKIGSKIIRLKNPDAEIEKIVQNTEREGNENKLGKRIRNVKEAIGQFIRRQKT